VATKTKKVKKSKTNPAKSKGKCLLTYVENSTPRAKLFDSKKDMDFFMDSFRAKYSHFGTDDGYWFDLCVTGITGEATSMDPTYDVFDET
jgi:hypothetical protein